MGTSFWTIVYMPQTTVFPLRSYRDCHNGFVSRELFLWLRPRTLSTVRKPQGKFLDILRTNPHSKTHFLKVAESLNEGKPNRSVSSSAQTFKNRVWVTVEQKPRFFGFDFVR